jgi:hypothetical protein
MRDLTNEILELIRRTSSSLPKDVEDRLRAAVEKEAPGSAARGALETILKNVELSRAHSTPICQDTGTPIFYVHYPEGWSTRKLRAQIESAVATATQKSYLRPNSVNSLSGKNTGNNLGDFLFGLRSKYELSTFFITNLRQFMHFAYLQDDVRLTSKLTANVGLRYEFGSPQWDADNHLSNFNPSTGTMVRAGGGSLSERALVNPDYTDFAPRVGFAYQALAGTVIRSSYGISYTHFNRSGSANLLPINAPQVVFGVVNQTPSVPGFRTTQDGFPASMADPASFNPVNTNPTYMPADDKHTYVQSWHFSVQRELPRGAVLELAYVGNRANRVLYFSDFNPAQPNQPGASLSIAQRQSTRPFPGWGSITIASNGAFSSYHAMQVRLERRFSGGLFFLNSFTWSKAMDNASGSLENGNGNAVGPQNPRNLAGDKSVSMYDQPFTNATSVVWQLPFGKGKKWFGTSSRAMDILIGGWGLNGISNAFSGAPVNLIYSAPSAFQVNSITADFRGASYYRVNVTGNPVAENPRRTTGFFNLDNIRIPLDPSQPFGNAGRNIARSRPLWQFDLAVHKNIALTETAKLQFRAEAFNILNRTNFLPPSSSCSSWTSQGVCTTGSFGTITSTLDPRLVQFGLKLSF